jgi:hypothetical protein
MRRYGFEGVSKNDRNSRECRPRAVFAALALEKSADAAD